MMNPSFGAITDKSVQVNCWLTIGVGDAKQWNRRPSVRVSAGEPRLSRNERALRLAISLPLALFEAPMLSARIEVAEPAETIRIDTTAIAEAVKSAVGLDIDVHVLRPELPE